MNRPSVPTSPCSSHQGEPPAPDEQLRRRPEEGLWRPSINEETRADWLKRRLRSTLAGGATR